MDKKYCKVCGREGKTYDGLCRKHANQMLTYNMTLDENRRCEDDPNELTVMDNCVLITLYDDMQEEVKEKAIVDSEDLDLIKGIRWNTMRQCIATKVNGDIVMLQNYILNTTDKVEFINNNHMDFRKENLKVISKEVKDKKIDKRRKGKIDIVGYGASVTQVTSSSWGIFYDDTKLQRRNMCLIECGLAQGGTINEDYNLNKNIVDSIPFDRCGFMLFSHCHL